MLGGDISLQGVVLAGLVFAALGVLADQAVTQASAVLALRRANPAMSGRQLYLHALSVGRDHLVATTHTLVLVYVGATFPLLLVLDAGGVGGTDALNREDLAEPIVATLVGAIALLISVPLVTALTARDRDPGAGRRTAGRRRSPSPPLRQQHRRAHERGAQRARRVSSSTRHVAPVQHQRVALGVGEDRHVADAGVDRLAEEDDALRLQLRAVARDVVGVERDRVRVGAETRGRPFSGPRRSASCRRGRTPRTACRSCGATPPDRACRGRTRSCAPRRSSGSGRSRCV